MAGTSPSQRGGHECSPKMTASPRGNSHRRTRPFGDISCGGALRNTVGKKDSHNSISLDDGKSLAGRHDLANTGDLGLDERSSCLVDTSSCPFPSDQLASKTFEQSLQDFCQTLNPLGTSRTATQTLESRTRTSSLRVYSTARMD
ncbi:hypothetical protein TGVAND_238270 [Toxoplasma gondii VAND]|uniref:Uncharacterized protein n=3 Tax=Toxoplasma gondii TaxID=5811 RepID=A0A2T6INV4_TOXGO|nr:hypothetical protein TGP89_238270 [Toxoplasma gondii p89]KFG99584.1 hypothetical protein TGVAND_238270 [Toxoplasma gondii VAND]PUA87001.1 hypothetical protein TGBR9_238270 [Toxoplasma gondii TgCATBr9]